MSRIVTYKMTWHRKPLPEEVQDDMAWLFNLPQLQTSSNIGKNHSGFEFQGLN